MKKKHWILVAGLFASLVASFGTSLAWFQSSMIIDRSDQLGGKFISTFFHGGKGTKDKPFEITTPFHYENLFKLHYEQTSFATTEYYFAFGSKDDKMPGAKTTPLFYYTDENGVVDATKTSSTLNLGKKILPPLGCAEYPFIGHLEGNGLTISNFTIAGEGYFDVGVFGFVNSTTNSDGSSPINNCYWKKFTIDTNKTSNIAHKHDTSAFPTREHYDDDNDCEVGYLAGHTVNASSFSNCYVNECTVSSTGSNAPLNSSYGYFGKCEKDYMGGSTGKGHNYKFKLDSEAIFRSTRQVYQTVKDYPISTRDTYTEYTTPISGLPEVYESYGEYKTKHPISDAISFDGNRTYTLNGAYRSTSAARNYSFSTLGYRPIITSTTPLEYETFYYNDSGAASQLPENITFRSDWKGKDIKTNAKDDFNTITEKGDFVYYNGTDWKYIHSENKPSVETGKKSFTLNLDIPEDSVNFSGFAGLGTSGSIDYAHGYLYIDNTLIHEEDLTSKVKCDPQSTNIDIKHVAFNTKTFNVNLTRGKHYYEYYYVVRAKTKPWIGSHKYSWYWFSNTGNQMNNTSDANLTVTAGTFNVTQDLYDSSTRVLPTLNCSDHAHRNKDDTAYNFNITNDTRAASSSDIPPYVNSGTFQKTIYGTCRNDSKVYQMSDSALLFRKETGTTTEYDPTTGEPYEKKWYKWVAYNTPQKTVDYSVDPTYFSDNPDITPKLTPTGYTSGYQWDNIDIVGGGVEFYYRNLPLFSTDIRVVTLPAENTSAYQCGAVPASDIGKRFYATKYCPASIVMYFYNSANASDAADVQLGHIDFKYANVSMLGQTLINIEEPSFKKGSGNFVTLDTFGTKTGSGTISVFSTYSCDITESGAKACSYCALDKDRNILGVFDSNGNPSTGFIKDDGSIDKQKEMQIDTYVIALGCNSTYTRAAWLSEVNFEYVSHEGYGGSFGKIEYRDSPDKVSTTLLNFFVNIPSSATFTIKVTYIKSSYTVGEVTYDSYYKIEATTDVALTFNIYLYSNAYCFTFNGTAYTASTTGLVCSPP